MARPASRIAREQADLYATRRMVVEILRYLDRGAIDKIRSATTRRILKPMDDNVIIAEQDVRDAFEMILDEAVKHPL